MESATKAAAAGGITTVVDMPLNSMPTTTTAAILRAKIAAVKVPNKQQANKQAKINNSCPLGQTPSLLFSERHQERLVLSVLSQARRMAGAGVQGGLLRGQAD